MAETPTTPAPREKKAPQPNASDKPLDKEIHDLISDAVGPLWEKMGVNTAIVIAKVPNSDKMSLYYRGHFYDVATLLAKASSKFNAQIDRELGR